MVTNTINECICAPLLYRKPILQSVQRAEQGVSLRQNSNTSPPEKATAARRLHPQSIRPIQHDPSLRSTQNSPRFEIRLHTGVLWPSPGGQGGITDLEGVCLDGRGALAYTRLTRSSAGAYPTWPIPKTRHAPITAAVPDARSLSQPATCVTSIAIGRELRRPTCSGMH